MELTNLETSLRSALAKGDIADAAFRRRVYEAAASAMKRSLETHGQPTEVAVRQQTERLTAAIAVIEGQLREPEPPRHRDRSPVCTAPTGPRHGNPMARIDPVPPIAPAPMRPAGGAGAPCVEPQVPPVAPVPGGDLRVAPVRPDAAPSVTAEPIARLRAEPRRPVTAEPRRPATAEPRRKARGQADPAPASRPRRRGMFAKLFSAVIVIAAIFAAGWWVLVSGAFTSRQARDTSVPNPPPTLENDDFAGHDPGTASAPLRLADIAAGEDGWVTLFLPSDPTVLRLQGGARAAVETDPFGDYARILTPGADSAVQIGIPQGVLQRLTGQTIQVAIRAQTDDGVSTQMSVTCDLAEMGNCGRHRFTVAQSPAEFLFEVDMPAGVRSSRAGTLNIKTDIGKGERALMLLAVRMRGTGG